MKTYGRGGGLQIYSSIYSQPRLEIVVIGQHHASAALPVGKDPLYPMK